MRVHHSSCHSSNSSLLVLAVDTILCRVYRFVSVGPPPPTLLVDLCPRNSRICLPIPLDNPVSEDCICPPLLTFLMFGTMLVCLHISHIDAFHVPVSRIEMMVVCPVSVLCLVTLLPLRMCTPDQLFPLIPGSLLPPILLWARPEPVSFPSQCHSYISGGVQVN